MSGLILWLPWLIPMGVLILASAFFSSSEAALFYLNREERSRLAEGNRAQRVAAALLSDPDRLLTAVLFWNLVTNIAYFTSVSVLVLRLEREGHGAEAGLFGLGALVVIIVFSEMLPKSFGVTQRRLWAPAVSIPLTALVRLVDPLLPVFRTANVVSRRVLWPRFQPEPYLRVIDLERALELSASDAALLEHEHRVLQNIVSLSAVRADELMRPRKQFLVFHPPVALADVQGRLPPSGCVLVAEPDSDEVAGAIPLRRLVSLPEHHLEKLADRVVYVPWCTTVAEALEAMRRGGAQVAAVVNEFGETIGILTMDDVLDTIFSWMPSRSQRLLKRSPIHQVRPGVWQVTGMTSLRRLVRYFRVPRPPSRSVTVAGVIQESLERLPRKGDQCQWGPFHFRVVQVLANGQILVEVRRRETPEGGGR
ncbi:MAG TPA: HlyC/CorC family transporter [Planctomycetaceae bacterium]|nr:HlyC/CorC family transporter [Planctomycetaceae bacterium]